MECSICYCEGGNTCKLTCGHVFCNTCVKAWYRKSDSPTCPMCRRPMYFKGFHKIRDQWDEDSWEEKCSDIFGQAIDEAFEQSSELAEMFGRRTGRQIMLNLVEDIKELESTLNALKSWSVSSEEIEYIILETDDYYSHRRSNRSKWEDEPVKEFLTRYPMRKDGKKGGKRCRALEDEWATLNIVFVL